MTGQTCSTCHGKKLRKEALSVHIHNQNIIDVTSLSVKDSLTFFKELPLTETEKKISTQVLKEILSRLSFLVNVGLDYLTLDRSTGTLSGGESQRIRLATQIGSALSGVIYVLDEPSIGLHQKDNHQLIEALKALRDIGNTLIVVEHDEATMLEADYIVDLGPGAGAAGGYIVAAGTLEELMAHEESVTGRCLREPLQHPLRPRRRVVMRGANASPVLTVRRAALHNLQGVDVRIPLARFVCVTAKLRWPQRARASKWLTWTSH